MKVNQEKVKRKLKLSEKDSYRQWKRNKGNWKKK